MAEVRTNTGSTQIDIGDVCVADAATAFGVQRSASSGQAGFVGVALAVAGPTQRVPLQTNGLVLVNVTGAPAINTLLQPGPDGRAEAGTAAPALLTQGPVGAGRVAADIIGSSAATARATALAAGTVTTALANAAAAQATANAAQAGVTALSATVTALTPGHVIHDESTARTQRGILAFAGAGVTATDDSGGGRTVVTIPGGGGAGFPYPLAAPPTAANWTTRNFTGSALTDGVNTVLMRGVGSAGSALRLACRPLPTVPFTVTAWFHNAIRGTGNRIFGLGFYTNGGGDDQKMSFIGLDGVTPVPNLYTGKFSAWNAYSANYDLLNEFPREFICFRIGQTSGARTYAVSFNGVDFYTLTTTPSATDFHTPNEICWFVSGGGVTFDLWVTLLSWEVA